MNPTPIVRKVRWFICQGRYLCYAVIVLIFIAIFSFLLTKLAGLRVIQEKFLFTNFQKYQPGAQQQPGDTLANREDLIDYDANYQLECADERESKICKPLLKYHRGDWHPDNKFTQNELMDLRNVLLVVQFGEPTYISASKMFALYSRIFADVVFCGPDTKFWPQTLKARRHARLFSLPERARFISYGEPTKHYGENAYICLDLALANDTRSYTGVLVTADDVMLNYWTWKAAGLSLDKNWLIKPSPNRSIFEIRHGIYCSKKSSNNTADCAKKEWPGYENYSPEIFTFTSELKHLVNDDIEDAIYWEKINKNLMKATGGERRLLRGPPEVFYITKRYISKIRPFFQLLNKHRVWLEVAVPTAILGLTEPGDIQLLEAKANLNQEKSAKNATSKAVDFMANVYRPDSLYWHPFKMLQVFYDETPKEYRYSDRVLKTKISLHRDRFKPNDWTITCVYCYTLSISLTYQQAIPETATAQ